MATPREVIDALWSGVTGGHVWLRTFKPGQKDPVDNYYRWPSEADTLLSVLAAHQPGDKAYVGAGIRSEPTNMRKHVSLVTSWWTTIDLGAVPLERAIEALQKFPAKPSAGIKMDDVLLAFWFLKEPFGSPDFEYVWAGNKTILPSLYLGTDSHRDPILAAHGLQASHYDFDGLIRSPGQPGAKIVCWRPEARYTLDEFIELVCPKKEQPAPAPAAPPGPAACTPAVTITAEESTEIAKALGEIWMENSPVALHVAGMLARAGIAIKEAKEIIQIAAKASGGDVKKKLAEVENTYKRHAEGQEIAGAPSLLKFIEEQFPPVAKLKAKKAVDRIQKLIPERAKPEQEPDFHLVRPIVKFDSRPARWAVKVRVPDGRELEVTVETQSFISFNMFQAAFYEQTHAMLGDISQYRWKRMIGEEGGEPEVRETPPEAKPDGAISTSLDEFLSDAKENPDIGLLKSFPGYDEGSRFFRFAAFRDYLKENGVKSEDRVVFDFLKRSGFKNDVKRFGPKLQRLWIQAFGPTDGNGHADLIPPSPAPPAAPEAPQTPDLFAGEGGLSPTTEIKSDLQEGEGPVGDADA